MAGDWIPMRLDLCDDPAVLEMADILDQPEEYVVGCLHKVWSWASRNCHDGTVTGVTKMSLSRAVKLPEAVAAMLAVGWLVEGKGADGRPFVSFPKWENWLSKSAKARLQNSMNQRKARQTKVSADQPAKADQPKDVTDLSLPDRDKTVTTVQKSTVQESNQYVSLSLLKIRHFEFLSKNTACPEWLAPMFCRWLAFRTARDGHPVDEVLQDTWTANLIARGQEKALADIEFSITKQAKNLLHSENDFDKMTKAKIDGATKPAGKETAAEAMRRIFRGEA